LCIELLSVINFHCEIEPTQIRYNNLVHFPYLKSLDTTFPEHIQVHSHPIYLLREEFDKQFQDFKITEPQFLLFALTLKTGIETATENLQMELINLKCDTNLNLKFSEKNLQDTYSHLPTGKFPVLRAFALKMTAMFGSTCECEQYFPL
jgi:hypothetical protein